MTKPKLTLLAAVATCVFGSTETLAQNAYITNSALNEVQVIDTATNRITTAIAVGNNPETVGVSSDGSRIYVGNCGDSGSVSIIDGTSNSMIITIPVGPVVLNGGTCAGGIAVSPDNSKVYVASQTDVGTVSIIDAKTDTITATVTIPAGVFALAVTPNGRRLYITSPIDTVSVLDTASNAVIATINTGTTSTGAGSLPSGVAVSPDGSKVYVALYATAAVAVIDTATNTIVATIPITGAQYQLTPYMVAVTPDGARVYVTILNGTFVPVIDTATNTVIANVTVGVDPLGVDVTPDGKRVYVANVFGSCTPNCAPPGSVSVIDTATNRVTDTIAVGGQPLAFGRFIPSEKPLPKFAGVPGRANCHGKSVSALARQYGGLNNAAAALGYPSVSALQNAIEAYCEV
jgi:YVTN family beta-propeller protein